MDFSNIFYLIFDFVPRLIIIAAAIIYYKKLRRISAILIIISSFINLSIFVFYMIISPQLIQIESFRDFIANLDFTQIISFVGSFSHLIFAIGFIMIIYEVIGLKTSSKS